MAVVPTLGWTQALGALGAPASNVLVQALGDANPFVRQLGWLKHR